MDPKKLPKETYCVPQLVLSAAYPCRPLAASVGGGEFEGLEEEDWTF